MCFVTETLSFVRLLVVSVSVALLLPACSPSQPVQTPAPSTNSVGKVARVGNQWIGQDALEREMGAEMVRRPGPASQVRTQALESLIQFEVLYARAQAAGMDKDAESIQKFRRWVVSRYETHAGPNLDKLSPPSDDAIRAYYEAHLEKFEQPAKVRTAILSVKVPRKADTERRNSARSRLEALRVLENLPSVEKGFGDLARIHSEDAPSRYRGGDQGWQTPSQVKAHWGEAVAVTLDELKEPGQLSAVVEHPEGFCLVRLMERKPASQETLASVRDRISWALRKQQELEAQAAFQKSARDGLSIEVFPEAVEAVAVPPEPPASKPPSGVPGS